MTTGVQKEIDAFMAGVTERNPHEPEFQQAVLEVVESLMPFVLDDERYTKAHILERMTEPDRIVIFRVPWETDDGDICFNRAWRVQFNNSIGPYKGGLRFHPSVNQSILKFLGFEQTFKNSLTGLPMGGAKGGSNFDPKGKSEREVMRFCQSMMQELHRHIGEDTDVPAGDIGVGGREIGFLFGQYKRLENRLVGVLTGKGLAFGGSAGRTEATGFGAVYFTQNMLERIGEGVDGRKCVISGSGNVALHCAQKLVELGGKVLTLSDSSGFVHDKDGLDMDKLAWIKELKSVRRGRISEYAEKFGADFHEGKRPWGVECDLAFPCATQNELDGDDAKALVDGGVRAVAEGANMPTTLEGVHTLQAARVLYAPGKAANAGGVAVSGLEQSQNALRISWSPQEVDSRLRTIMHNIHSKCVEHGADGDDWVDYVKGANIGGFIKVAEAMLAYGVN
jgi:glutamate dehydrogenase (NADP+)